LASGPRDRIGLVHGGDGTAGGSWTGRAAGLISRR
jgi:hypothetical protein